MPLSKCLRCKELFNKIENPICTRCMPEEESDFEKVRDYVKDNPENNSEVVAEMTGVDIKCVNRMVDQGNIAMVIPDDLGSAPQCGQCGAPAISASKKLCQPCLDQLNKKMMTARKNIKIGQKKKTEVGEYNSVRSSLDEKRK